MKRQRSEVSATHNNPLWWTRICDDIRSEGGHVNELLVFDEDTRELKISASKNDAAAHAIKPDTVLFKIPITCIMTRERALGICPWLRSMDECSRQDEKEAANESKHGNNITQNPPPRFYNDPTDVMIAIALASESPNNLLYLQSLPSSSAFDALPRRWSDDKIQELLSNTSIFDRVQKAKMGAKEDYGKAKLFYEMQEEMSQIQFPSFERFSDMLAAVTSRAFQIGDSTKDIALVPLLDLSNHSRGFQEEKKNASYQLVQGNKIESDVAFMMVTSIMEIEKGECLRLTYGALGNAQLLFNYGFCIPHNLEPDGSSNDVLDFEVEIKGNDDDCNEKLTIIPLRAGPKSYSYSGFKAALDAFSGQGSSSENNTAVGDSFDEFESFLNDNGEDEGEEDDEDRSGFDNLYESGDPGEAQSDETDKNALEAEMRALLEFQDALVNKYNLYPFRGEALDAALTKKPGPTYFASLLQAAEQRTIFFFLKATRKVYTQICPNSDAFKSFTLDLDLPPDDLSLIEKQTTELSKAYLAIRGGL